VSTLSSPASPSVSSPVSTDRAELIALRLDAQGVLRSKRKRVRQVQTGASVSKALGRGLDFAESRIYQPGDDIRNMDWNVTARSGIAHTKLFVEEKEKPVFLLIDLGPSMWFATRGMFKAMLAARLATLLAWCAAGSNDRVGGIVVAGNWHREIKPRAGRHGVMSLIRSLLDAQDYVQRQKRDRMDVPAAVNTAGSDVEARAGAALQVDEPHTAAVSLERNIRRLRQLSKAGGEVIILSDFSQADIEQQAEEPVIKKTAVASTRQTASDSLNSIAALGDHAVVTLIRIFDPLEKKLPAAGKFDVLMQGARGRLSQEKSARKKHEALFAARENALTQLNSRSGRIRMRQFATTTGPVEALRDLYLPGA